MSMPGLAILAPLAMAAQAKRVVLEKLAVNLAEARRAGAGRRACSERGLGSNRSIWLGPPVMNRKMHRLAFAAICGGLAASGLTAGPGRPHPVTRRPWSRDESAKQPEPVAGPRQEFAPVQRVDRRQGRAGARAAAVC